MANTSKDRRPLEQQTLDFLHSPGGRRQEEQARRLYQELKTNPIGKSKRRRSGPER